MCKSSYFVVDNIFVYFLSSVLNISYFYLIHSVFLFMHFSFFCVFEYLGETNIFSYQNLRISLYLPKCFFVFPKVFLLVTRTLFRDCVLFCVTWTYVHNCVPLRKTLQVSWTLFYNQVSRMVRTLPVRNLLIFPRGTNFSSTVWLKRIATHVFSNFTCDFFMTLY